MADRSIAVRLRAEIADFKRQMAEAAKASEQVGDKAQQSTKQADTALGQMVQSASKNEQAWTQVGTVLTGVGIAAAAGVGAVVGAFADFDAQMSSVQAATHETSRNMDLLRDAALNAGKETVFSATESAGAIEQLARAGVSTVDILGGGLNGALSLAAAGQIEVATAAELAASAMTQFNLEGADVEHIADLLAAGAGKAQGSVGDMGEALNQAGLVANQFDLSIEDTVGTLTAFAAAGMTGSDAGTSLRTMLLRLANPTDQVSGLMADLGIAAYDSAGEFVGLDNLAGQLQTSMEGLTQAERDQALAMIFGQDAIRGANILLKEGAAGIQEWTAAVDEQGYAAETAALKMDNLKGDVEALGGSLETALIQSGSAANGVLREMAQTATDVVNAYLELPPEAQATALALTAVVAAASLTGGGFLLLSPRIVETRKALATLRTDMPRTAAAMSSLAKVGAYAAGIGATAVAAGMLVEALTGHDAALGANELLRALEDVVEAGGDLSRVDAAFQNTGKVFGLARVEADSLSEAFDQMLRPSVTDRISAFFGMIPGVTSYMEILEDRATQVDAALAGMVAAGDVEQVEDFRDALANEGYSLEEINELLPETKDALIGAAEAQADMAEQTETVTTAAEQQAVASEEAAKALADWMEEVSGADAAFVDLLGAYDAIIAKNRETAEAAAESSETTEDSWQDFYDGFSVATQDYLAELEQQVVAQNEWETNMLLLSSRVSQGVIDELARLGPEGAPLVANLVTASDEELARLETVYGQRSTAATNAFAENLRSAAPILAEVMATAGTEAADAAAARLASGEATLQDIIDEYDLDFVVDADTSQALSAVQALWNRYANKSMTVYIDAVARGTGSALPMQKQAYGGEVLGSSPHSRADNIPIWATAGEWVTQKPAVDFWGPSTMDAVNRMDVAALKSALTAKPVQGLAYGGMVGAGWGRPVEHGGPGRGGNTYQAVIHNHGQPVSAPQIISEFRVMDMMQPAWEQ